MSSAPSPHATNHSARSPKNSASFQSENADKGAPAAPAFVAEQGDLQRGRRALPRAPSGTKVVSVAEREAIHTLEAILHTELPIAEHTTDTHGATEIVFALFDLLGLRFIPRLRDAGDLRLNRLSPASGLPVEAVLRGKTRPERIVEHDDDLLRIAGSLKRGWVPASPLVVTRMKNSSPQSPLAAAPSEYGRIVRTNFLLRYCADPRLRARIAGTAQQGSDPPHPQAPRRDRLPRPASKAHSE